MTETEFITLVSRMRAAQKKAARSRDKVLQDECRELERQVDEELRRIMAFTNPPSFQPSIFQQPL